VFLPAANSPPLERQRVQCLPLSQDETTSPSFSRTVLDSLAPVFEKLLDHEGAGSLWRERAPGAPTRVHGDTGATGRQGDRGATEAG
jgi:hypothetical protein